MGYGLWDRHVPDSGTTPSWSRDEPRVSAISESRPPSSEEAALSVLPQFPHLSTGDACSGRGGSPSAQACVQPGLVGSRASVPCSSRGRDGLTRSFLGWVWGAEAPGRVPRGERIVLWARLALSTRFRV